MGAGEVGARPGALRAEPEPKAPQESARILGEAIDYARQGQREVAKMMQPVASR